MVRQINGFTLIEVLVSLFVLAIGVIGAAAMQLTALRTAQQSAYQTAALQLAAEMADRMRASRHPISPSDADNPYLQIDFRSIQDAAAEPTRTCYAVHCDAQGLAQAEISDWISRVDKALPGARAKICRDVAPWNSATSSYTWDCATGALAANAPVVIKIGWRWKKSEGGSNDAAEQGHADFPPSLAMAVAIPLR